MGPRVQASEIMAMGVDSGVLFIEGVSIRHGQRKFTVLKRSILRFKISDNKVSAKVLSKLADHLHS